MTTNNAGTRPTIGFIGMGSMGSRMAQRLIQAGYTLTVYDRTRTKAQDVARSGASIANTPREIATNCDVIMTSVADNHALSEIMREQDGILAGTGAGKIFIDLSTVSPKETRHLAEEVKQKGADMIDAAVSGSTPQVEQGSLVILVGGERETYQRCKPILDHLGKSVFYMGTHGMGQTTKLVINTLLGLEMQAFAEALALGEKAGLEKSALLDVLGQTAVITPSQKSKFANFEKEEFPATFALALMRKDFGLIMRLAAELSVSMPAAAAAEQMYAAAIAQGGGEEDFSAIVQFMEKMAGLQKQVVAMH